VRPIDIAPEIGRVPRVDREQRRAACACEPLDCRGEGIDRMHGRLAAERFAELEQEVVALRDRDHLTGGLG
jgi:hypothetical protein